MQYKYKMHLVIKSCTILKGDFILYEMFLLSINVSVSLFPYVHYRIIFQSLLEDWLATSPTMLLFYWRRISLLFFRYRIFSFVVKEDFFFHIIVPNVFYLRKETKYFQVISGAWNAKIHRIFLLSFVYYYYYFSFKANTYTTDNLCCFIANCL